MSKEQSLFFPGVHLGLIGGGQLARMICLEAHKLGLNTSVLSLHKDDPAAQLCHKWYQGDINNPSDLRHFLKNVSVATFESEFLNPQTLKEATKNLKVKIHPSPKAMAICQDRLSQKKLLEDHNLPTSPYMAVGKEKDLDMALLELKLPLVLKKRFGGYDGYGTFILKTSSDVKKFRPLLTDVANRANNRANNRKNNRANNRADNKISSEPIEGFIAEKFIPFKKEVALVVVRNQKGQWVCLPWVETHQKDSRCFWVKGPIKIPKSKAIEKRISKMLETLNYVGAMGLEFFIDKKGELIVNEIAPRVHNSAHYSQDALDMDQFQLHIRAMFDWNLAPPQLKAPGFAMVNLLSELGEKTKPHGVLPTGAQLHWYGKKQKPHRKKNGAYQPNRPHPTKDS